MRYFKNTSWMMGEQLLRMIAGLLVGIWIVQYLGPEQFGIFSYAVAFTSIFVGVAKLGLDGSIIGRELINHPQQQDVYLGTAFWLKIMGASIVLLLLAIMTPFLYNDSTINLYIFIIATGFIFQSFEVIEFYFQSQVLSKIVSICKIIQIIISSVIKLYLILSESELIWFVLVTTFDVFSLAVTYIIAYKLKKNIAFYTHFDLTTAKQLLKNSWSLMLSAFLIAAYMRIDQILIKEILGEHDLGIYSSAIRLSEFFYVVPLIISTSLLPAVFNAKKNNEEIYRQRLQKIYNLMVWITVSTALLTSIFSEEIITILYSNEYKAASSVLTIHIWSNVFLSLGFVGSMWILAENLQIYTNYFIIIGIIINVSMNLLLIPYYGIVGSAMSVLISHAASSYLAPALFKKTRLRFNMSTKGLFFFLNEK